MPPCWDTPPRSRDARHGAGQGRADGLERRAMHQARIARVRMPGRRTDFTPPPEPSASRERIPARETGPPSIHRVQIRVYTSHATGQRRAQAGRQGAGDREGDGQTPPARGRATGWSVDCEITARLPPIARENLQRIMSEVGKSGCQRLPKYDLFATIRPHCHALDYKPEKALQPFIYRL